jgi:hypothetical protein
VRAFFLSKMMVINTRTLPLALKHSRQGSGAMISMIFHISCKYFTEKAFWGLWRDTRFRQIFGFLVCGLVASLQFADV